MKTNSLSLPKTFWWLNITQFGGAMNDNVFKLIIVYALIAWSGDAASATILAKVGLVFALPFILIVPIAGNFADRFSKRNIIVKLKALECGIMGFGILALHLQSEIMLYVTMFLMSSQSAFFGPCKDGIIPEQVGVEKLSKANGMLQLFVFIAIIFGTVLAPELSLLTNGNYSLAAMVCLLIAGIGFVASLKIETSPAHPERKLSFNGFTTIFRSFSEIRKDGFLTLAVFSLAFFSLCGAFTQLNVLEYGEQHLGLKAEEATRLFLLTAVGIGIGSTTAGWLSGRAIEFGIVPIGAFLMSTSLFILGSVDEGSIVLSAMSMSLLGFASGLFIVPLQAFIQYRSPKDRVGSIQAARGFVGWIAILLASGFIYLNSSVLEWTAQRGFACFAWAVLALALFSLWVLPDFFIKFVVMLITRSCYRYRTRGLHNIPATGGALLVCNHVSLMDAILVISSQQRRIRMLMSRNFYDNANWFTRKIADIAKVILINEADNPKKLVQSLKTARAALDEGYLVCIFAEGHLSRTGMMRPFKQGFQRIVKGSNHPIIPVYIGGAWGSVASYYDGMPKIQLFKDFRYPVSIQFGKALPTASSTFEVQQAVTELSVDSFNANKTNHKSLVSEFIKSARNHWNKLAIADSSGKELKYGELLTASLILKKRIQTKLSDSEKCVGLLLPTGIGSAISNIAASLDKRIAVNLNYTAPAASFESALQQCEIATIITSKAFLKHLPDLPLTDNIIYMEDIMAEISRGEKAVAYLKAKALPLNSLITGEASTPDDTATILFSSGSTAEPKGVMLSHHNLLSNIESFRSVVKPIHSDVLIASLPFFHSFGYTVTFWFPLLSGMTMACHTSPLESEAIGQLSEKYKASILLTTPSFLLSYIRKVKPEHFANLRLVFTGAEKLQDRIGAMFVKRFGIQPLEGYGATELAPVCALSLPNQIVDDLEETGFKDGRLGRTLPGIAMKILHAETGERLAPGEEGLIHVKGPNVMTGYLNKPELTASVVLDGWYNTGDIGLMDSDGFFAITGRQSRFSKLGGEMISHGAIEKAMLSAFQLEPDALAVVALPDDKKGEKLCVVHTSSDLDESTIRETLKMLDIPNLWKPNPKNWVHVATLPMIASGKLDYRAMKSIAATV